MPQNIWKVACFSLKTPGNVTESNRCAHLVMQCELYLLTHLCQFSPLPVNKNSGEMKQQHLNVISQDHQQVSLSLKRCRLVFFFKNPNSLTREKTRHPDSFRNNFSTSLITLAGQLITTQGRTFKHSEYFPPSHHLPQYFA